MSPFMASAARIPCGGVAVCIVGALAGERFTACRPRTASPRVRLPIAFGSRRRLLRLRLAAAACASAGRQLRLRQSRDRGGAGAWLAHERFGTHELLAMGVILLGVVAITLAKARKPAPSPRSPDRGRNRVSDVADRRRGVWAAVFAFVLWG